MKYDIIKFQTENPDEVVNIIDKHLNMYKWKKVNQNSFKTYYYNLKIEKYEHSLDVILFAKDQWGTYYSSKFSLFGLGLISRGVKKIRNRLISEIQKNSSSPVSYEVAQCQDFINI